MSHYAQLKIKRQEVFGSRKEKNRPLAPRPVASLIGIAAEKIAIDPLGSRAEE
jgi:hypothetical protein